MKRKVSIIAIVVVLIAAAVGAAWLYFGLNPTAWEAFLAEMQGGPTARTQTSRAEPRPVQRPARAAAGLVASGNVEVEEVSVAAEVDRGRDSDRGSAPCVRSRMHGRSPATGASAIRPDRSPVRTGRRPDRPPGDGRD